MFVKTPLFGIVGASMSITKEQAVALLRDKGLRSTAPRLAVLMVLAETKGALSHTEMLDRLGETDWDPATIYRNLVKLRDAGLAPVVHRADGIDRYALAGSHGHNHRHAHFVCEDCGQIACLPANLTASMHADERWGPSVQQAMIQLRGECPDCIVNSAES